MSNLAVRSSMTWDIWICTEKPEYPTPYLARSLQVPSPCRNPHSFIALCRISKFKQSTLFKGLNTRMD